MLHMSENDRPQVTAHETVPISALRTGTLQKLSASLNPHKVIASDEGLPRDWRGLAHLVALSGAEMHQLAALPDPTAALITNWSVGNVGLFCTFLEKIDRYDVLDDVCDLIINDCDAYKNGATARSPERRAGTSNSTSSSILNNEGDDVILTRDDVERLEQGLEPQIYDAYVLYVDEDVDFATELVHTMENTYNMKFCVRDRDLIGGITFEYDAVMKLIAERCRRLIVVVSSNFLKSPASKFLVTFAQALGIDQRQRKVVPVLYERCQLPPELSYYFLLDYNRAGKLYNFWEKLRDSIQAPKAAERKENRAVEQKKSVSSVSSVSSDIWISKTEFLQDNASGSKQVDEEPVGVPEGVVPEGQSQQKKEKNSTVYRIMKKVVRNKNKEEGDKETKNTKNSKPTKKLTPPSFMKPSDGSSSVQFEQFSNSSSFESPKDEKSGTKKKKWFRRKNVEPLLS